MSAVDLALSDDEQTAVWALQDLSYLASPGEIAALLPRLPAGHEETRVAQGLVDGMTLSPPSDWLDRMLDSCYAQGYWQGWTRAHDRVLRGWR
jgi:hypothetical protein